MSKIKLWENTHFDKIIAVYNDGTEEEIGYINDNGDKVYYGSSPSATAPKKFHSDWNQRQYDAYKQRQKAQLAQNGRSPDFGTLLYQHNRKVLKGASDLMRQAQARQQAMDKEVLENKVYRQIKRHSPALLVANLIGSAGYGMSYNDPYEMKREKKGLWVETFNVKTNKYNYSWVEGVITYEEIIKNYFPQIDYHFTGNYYERFAFHNGEGTVFGLSDGSTIYPSDNDYSGELIDFAKEGGVYTYDKFTEEKIKSIIERNKILGIKVDNFGTIRASPWVYKDFYARILRGEDVWKNLGGLSARGKWTTRNSAWQDPFNNYITNDAIRWSKSAKFFSESLSILGDVITFADIIKGGSPLGLLPIPVDMIVNEQALEMEKYLFEFALNNESFERMQNFISGRLRNSKAPLYEFYQQLQFIYTTDEQVSILKKGQLNVNNPYFLHPNEFSTKATLIQIKDNKILILKTYDIEN